MSEEYKIRVFNIGETKHFVKFESEQELTFKSGRGWVAKIWVSKKEFLGQDADGNLMPGTFPNELTVTLGQPKPDPVADALYKARKQQEAADADHGRAVAAMQAKEESRVIQCPECGSRKGCGCAMRNVMPGDDDVPF